MSQVNRLYDFVLKYFLSQSDLLCKSEEQFYKGFIQVLQSFVTVLTGS